MSATQQQREGVYDELHGVLARYTQILRRRWRAGLLALGTVGGLLLWCSQYLPRQYRASTTFERRDDAVLQNLVSQNSPYGFDHLRSSLTLDTTGLRAKADAAVSVGLIEKGAISTDGALSEEDARRVKDVLSRHGLNATVRLITSTTGLDVIELTADADNANLAREFVMALRDQYVDDTRKRMREVLDNTRQFFTAEMERRRGEAAEASAALEKHFADFPDLHSREPLTLATRMETYRTDRERLEEDLAQLEAQIAARSDFLTALSREAATTHAPSAPDAAPAPSAEEISMEVAIRNVEQEITDSIVVKQMTPEHPTVQALRRKIDALNSVKASFAEKRAAAATQPVKVDEPETAAAPARSPLARQVELELDTLQRQREIVRKRLEDARERYAKYLGLCRQLSDDSGELRRLDERVSQANASANVWRQHLTQLEQIAAAENEKRGTTFRLVEEPMTASAALAPRASAVFTVSMGIAFACALALMALLELLDRSVRDVSRAAALTGAPVLECLGVIATPAAVRARRMRGLLWSPALSISLLLLLGSGSMAYASFQMPETHRRLSAAVDRLLVPLGIPPVANDDRDEPKERSWEP